MTVELPNEEKGIPGTIVEGTYTTSDDGLIRVRDVEGKLLGTQRIGPADDAEVVARILLREKCRPGGFYDPIRYLN